MAFPVERHVLLGQSTSLIPISHLPSLVVSSNYPDLFRMSPEPSSYQKPLRRGLACQTCRKKKMRCTGERPVCGTCLRASQECIFEAVPQPKSRVQALENKIARLESVLYQTDTIQSDQSPPSVKAPRRGSSRVFPYPAPSYPNPNTFSDVTHPSRQCKRQKQQAFSQAFKELWGASSNSMTEGLGHVGNEGSTSANPTYSDNSNLLSLDVLDRIISETGPTRPETDPWAFEFSSLEDDNFGSLPTDFLSMDSDLLSALPIDNDQPSLDSRSKDQTATLKAYFLDRGELPKEFRDPLIHFFLSRMMTFGVMLNIERFWQRLENPAEEDQPHPAFLCSMYHCASQFSPDKAVRALKNDFFAASKAKLDEGMANWDKRMNDMIRTATVLGIASYSETRFLTAWVFGGVAMRLCTLAHYQRISFPFGPRSYDHPKINFRNPDRKTWVHMNIRVQSPKDSIEWGECIWSFWIAWGMDQRGSASSGFPPALHWSEIETPFPLPLEQYADIDRVNSQPITAVYGLFDDSQQTLVGDLSSACLFISLLFLNEASRLAEWFIQPSSRNEYLSHASSSFNSCITPPSTEDPSQSSTNSDKPPNPTGPVPTEIVQLQNALLRFVKSLPLERMNPAQKVRGGVPTWKSDVVSQDPASPENMSVPSDDDWGVSSENVLLHTEILTTHALILQQRADFEPSARAQAILSARSVVNIIHLIVDVDFSRLGFFILICWRMVAYILLDEVKRCKSIGNDEEAMSLTIDIELIVLALKRFGEVYEIGSLAASRIH